MNEAVFVAGIGMFASMLAIVVVATLAGLILYLIDNKMH